MSKTTPNRIAVEDLVGSFATPIPGPVLTPSKQNLERWEVHVDPEPPPFHVSPHLSICRPVPKGQLFCYLISAPAAVGKTTLANYMHHRLTQAGRPYSTFPCRRPE